jgi:hypothetical protein
MGKPVLRDRFTHGMEKYPELIKELEANWAPAITTLSREFTALKVGDVISLGVFDETENSVCFSMLVKSQLSRAKAGQEVNYVAISAGCLVRVRDRMLSLGCAAIYHDKSDIEWARHSVQTWRDAILAVNSH